MGLHEALMQQTEVFLLKILPRGAVRYHFIIPNIKKLLGRFHQDQTNAAYYNLAFQDCPTKICECEDPLTDRNTPVASIFTRKRPCPFPIDCQSYSQWKFNFATIQLNRLLKRARLRAKILKIYILPIGPFPEFVYQYASSHGLGLFQILHDYIRLFFTGCQVELLPEKDISAFKCTHRVHSFTQKKQYLVQDFFPVLRSMLPDDGFAIVGLSWHDLYPSENLNFVLGQASHQHFCCMASFGRFDPTSMKGFKGNEDGIPLEDFKDVEVVDASLVFKLIKVISHELCHVFGLSHCAMFDCLMNESRSSEEALSQPLVLCPLCMKKIAYGCGRYPTEKGRFQIRSHLAAILNFLEAVFGQDINAVDNRKEFCSEVTSQRIKSAVTWVKSTLAAIS